MLDLRRAGSLRERRAAVTRETLSCAMRKQLPEELGDRRRIHG